MDRFKTFITFLLVVFCTPTIFAVEENAQQKGQGKTETTVAKTYNFAEELIEIPIKPFVVTKVSDSELINMDPKLLKLYEAAANAEKQKNAIKNPNAVIKAWNEIAKITQKNPFLKAANERLAEWKKITELFDRHQNNLDKLKLLLASNLLSEEQKTNLFLLHLNEFGLSFGIKEVLNITATTAIPQNAAFQAKIKEIKQKRCEHNSGRDCFECGRYFATAEDEILALFTKSCNLKYKPGCDEINKIKATKNTQQNPAENNRTFNFPEQVFGLIEPFVLGQISDQDLINTDPKALQAYETAVNKEKEPDTVKMPGTMVAVWQEVTKITEKNPFLPTASKRLSEWQNCLAKAEKYAANTDEFKKMAANNSIPANYRAAVALNYLNEFGVSFGTSEFVKATSSNAEISNSEQFASKIKEVRKQRCELKSAVDCHNYAIKHSANEEEKAAYLKKACELGSSEACSGNPPAEASAAAPAENPQPQTAEQPKEPAKETAEQTEEDKFKEELNQAGRTKRLTIATSTLVAGVIIGALSGISFHGMNEAKKDHNKYAEKYNSLGSGTPDEEFEKWRKKVNNADGKRKKYMILGGVETGVGAALIATGITFYCIEFKEEKEVKKKYNVSLGANPAEGTLQFAINW